MIDQNQIDKMAQDKWNAQKQSAEILLPNSRGLQGERIDIGLRNQAIGFMNGFRLGFAAASVGDIPSAQPEQEPEMMRILDALNKARENGGEVWFEKDTYKKCTVAKDGVITWDNPSTVGGVIWDKPMYTVRPLAPALLPCPFCGGEAVECGNESYMNIRCKRCCAVSDRKTKPEAIAAWNRREGSGS
jgi:hypothetical protein